jgi:hypothetical protein
MSYGCSATGDASGFRGCGREFGDLRLGFDSHFVKVTTADDPNRDPATVGIDGSRCATDAELREAGMVKRRRDGVWSFPLDAEKARTLSRLRRRMRSSPAPKRG